MDTVAQLHEKLLAMNEALLLGSLRQNELTQAAEELNVQLRAEITQHRLTEELLRRSTAQFKTLLDEAPLGVYVVDADLRFCQANPIAFAVFGHIPCFIGQDFNEVVHILWPTAYADEVVERFRHTLETGEPYLVPERIETRRDRGVVESHEWQINRIPLPDGRHGVVCYFRDISERVQHQQQIRDSEERYRTLFDLGPVAIYTCDASGLIQQFNRRAAELWGREPAPGDSGERFCGSFKLFLQDGSFLPHEQCPMAEVLSGKIALARDVDVILEQPGGSRVACVVNIRPLKDQYGAITGAINCFYDVTERERLHQMLQDRHVELERATAVAEKASLAKSEFLSSMSHELRTPLSAILGFAQLMESSSPPPTPSQKRRVEQIVKAGWYLLDLINEILDLSLIESGKLSLSIESISLAGVMQECWSMIETQAQKRAIRVTFPRIDGPCYVNADHTRIKQVLINLLTNAIKYNRVDGAVAVDCTANDLGRIRVSVKDDGAGLPPEKIAQLFQPFNRLGQEERAEEGTGIGLALSKRLIELMGGEIGVDSTVGAGSVFWIELNLTPNTKTIAGAAPRPASSQAAAPAPLPRRTLLYVEDNPDNLALVEEIIERSPDIHLLSARDGISGVKMALASRPDVILMDINLRGISGTQAMQILADDPATAHIPVVALSANAMSHDIEKGLEAGFFRYLTKPINVNEFMDTLNVAFKFAKSQAGTLNLRTRHDDR